MNNKLISCEQYSFFETGLIILLVFKRREQLRNNQKKSKMFYYNYSINNSELRSIITHEQQTHLL